MRMQITLDEADLRRVVEDHQRRLKLPVKGGVEFRVTTTDNDRGGGSTSTVTAVFDVDTVGPDDRMSPGGS